jgi:hypothetical protein
LIGSEHDERHTATPRKQDAGMLEPLQREGTPGDQLLRHRDVATGSRFHQRRAADIVSAAQVRAVASEDE